MRNTERDARLNAMDNGEFDALMCRTFPRIFANRNKHPGETCMCWGFEVPPGWHGLLYTLCERMQYVATLSGYQPVADQVKSKFGTLRFYWHGESGSNTVQPEYADDLIEMLVDNAERETGHVCEVCGSPGASPNSGGWVETLCPVHRGKTPGKQAGQDNG